jgi:cobalt-zinc-cadmium efflux system membrane fusion protein
MASVPTFRSLANAASVGRWLPTIAGWISNLIVFGLLVAVFIVGHHTGWKLPKSSTLWGAAPVRADDWCADHLVPESRCLECKVELKPKLPTFGWCQRHGVAECVLCHPELAQTKEVPQIPVHDTAVAIALRPRPPNNSVSTLHTKVVQFTSTTAVEKVGVEVDVVGTGPVSEEVVASGEVTFDPLRVAHLSSPVPGTVFRVLKQVGEPVAAGEVLALVDAAAIGRAKADLLQAVTDVQTRKARFERLRPIAGDIANKTLVEAEALLREAEIKLIAAEQSLVNLGFTLPAALEKREPKELAEEIRFLGIQAELTASLRRQTQTTNLFPLAARVAGVLISSHAAAGELVAADKPAFVVADPSRMWLNLNIRQEDAPLIALGQRVRFETDDGHIRVEGQIDWISPTVDHKSRTLPVRVNLANANGRLRDNTFGIGRIVLREEPQAILVPKESVQTAGDVQLVFVRDKNYFAEGAPKFFHVRQVRLGARDDKSVELLAGALPGEVVATHGSNVLLAQLLRANLGAGCGCHDGHAH